MAAASPMSARLPLLAVMLGLLAATAAELQRSLRACEGHLVYPLDDAYIHMTMARNLATHGSWGITPGAFEPASSSPLWTLLLGATARAFGVRDALPLALGVLCTLALALVLDRLLRHPIPHPLLRAGALLVILPAIGLPGLALLGMEPVLHMLLALVLGWSVARRLAEPDPKGGQAAVAALSALAVLTRFESLLLIGTLALASLLRRRPATAVALVAGAALALAGYLAFSLPQGGFVLPNSVLLKAPTIHPRLSDAPIPFMSRIPEAFRHDRNEHLPGLLVAAVWFLLPRRRITRPEALAARLLLAVTGVTLLLHLQLAQLDGSFRRYEAYLVCLGVFGVAMAVASGLGGLPDGLAEQLRWLPAPAVAALVAIGFATPFVVRGLQLIRWTPLGTQNIYQQQIQMARFVRERFRDHPVAINDLGAVTYYGSPRVVDLCGLATMPIARAMLAKRYDTGFIERFCASEGVPLAMIYESWFTGPLSPPGTWAPVARWTLRHNMVAGDETVTLFATDPASAGRVRDEARAFAASLPRQVMVETVGVAQGPAPSSLPEREDATPAGDAAAASPHR